MLTLEQCKKLKEWGLLSRGSLRIYARPSNRKNAEYEKAISITTSCKDRISIPTLTELLEFAVDSVEKFCGHTHFTVNLRYSVFGIKRESQWQCALGNYSDTHFDAPTPELAVYKLIEKMSDAKD